MRTDGVPARDGRLMCVFRLYGSEHPFGQCWSGDDGRTWTTPAMMEPWAVEPRLLVMADGTVLLLGGRLGNWLWIDVSGTGTRWQAIDLLAHHNACRPEEPLVANDAKRPSYGLGRSSSYVHAAVLDDHRLVVVYHRTPRSFFPKPPPDIADHKEMYSCWIAEVRLRRT